MNRHKSLRNATTWFVFGILLASVLLTWLILFLARVILPGHYALLLLHPILLTAIVLFVSAIIGGILSYALSKWYLRPLSDLITATKAVAEGDYSVRVATDKLPVDIKEYRNPVNEFEIFVESFNKMAESLGSVEMLRTDFINTISHEFKTPVVSIRGFAKLLQNPDITEEQRKLYTDTIIRESLRLSSMSSNILLLSRYEHTSVLTDKQVFSLDEQIRESIRLQSADWMDKNIILEGNLEPVTYYGRPDILTHLWSNLLSNAIKFTPDGGSITVDLTRQPETVTVRFRDTGIGMDAEALAHIYEKFYQADSSRQSAGIGLGLSIVRRIVTLCNGEISVSSEPGKGTEFAVTLPMEHPPVSPNP